MKKFVVAVGNNDGINPATYSRFFKCVNPGINPVIELEKEAEFETFKEAAGYIEEFVQGKETSYNHFEVLEYIDDGAVRRWQDLPSIYCVIL